MIRPQKSKQKSSSTKVIRRGGYCVGWAACIRLSWAERFTLYNLCIYISAQVIAHMLLPVISPSGLLMGHSPSQDPALLLQLSTLTARYLPVDATACFIHKDARRSQHFLCPL